MSEFKLISLVNLFILILCAFLARFLVPDGTNLQSGIMLNSMAYVIIQVLLNFLLAIIFGIMGRPVFAKAFLGNSGLVLLVGFSVCWGNASI